MNDPHPTMLLHPGEWWACSFPERPVDADYTSFWAECRACGVALEAAKRHLEPGDGVDVRSSLDPFGFDFIWTLHREQLVLIPTACPRVRTT